MKAAALQPECIHEGSLVLVNADHAYQEGRQRVTLEQTGPCGTVLLERRANTLLAQLMAQLGGWRGIVAVSGWRSQAEQQQIWDDSLREHGPAFTAQYVAKPGHSEHQTGLAIDLGASGPDLDFIRPEFPDRGVCRAFCRSAARFGFIRRYPAGKEHVTGIAYEPWHFRYVGAPHAQIMEERGLTLEEYLEFLRAFPCGGEGFSWHSGQGLFRIFYAAAEETEPLSALTGQLPCQVSGDNVGGFVVTRWEAQHGA